MGLTFFPIPEFDEPVQLFGAPESCYFKRHNLPKVPQKYVDLVSTLFFKGGALPEFQPEVDRAKAFVAVRAWLHSFAPAHEAKEATVGYALWLWCEGDLKAKEGAK